ncbi:hypothetical protein RclHR1_34790001 [Rhizophagus clarus]|uniref:Protein kinase domain-containing protein n=1 Tax=Rhizophagus clarus TaxID=94130 RepID=A0A2Z6S4V8_9GLOM|nr:hypothetical protein RclHR1_34790001 [Rhizophagus clarus]
MKLEFLTKNFANWTSGNEIIDNFIQEWQSEYNGYGKVFEWVPYDKFIEIKEKRKSIAAAIWKEGPLSYNKNDEEWIRLSYEKVTLRYLYDSGNITDEFINKVKSHLLDRENYYGISQKPDTKDYILVFSKAEFESRYCKKCGDKYEYDREDYKDYRQYLEDEKYKWCKSCHINHLENNFTNQASGNEKIEKINNFIQQRQLNIKTSFDLIFEWIPFNEFIEIKEIGKAGFSVAIWKEGPLHYKIIEKEWMRKSYRKVVLKYLSNLQNITDEFLNETTVIYDSYGISQNPSTKEYILVVHHKYSKKYCAKCDKDYIKPDHNWCEPCQINYLKNNFINWTSGNEKIDDFIQKKQLKISNENSNVFEWIPYDEFIEIKEIGDNCLITAIWKKGSLIYNTHEKKWMRALYKNVCLKYLYYFQSITDEFINKVESLLTNEIYYGVSQNPDTKVYILVFENDYFNKHCEKCGNKRENRYVWCKCYAEYLKDDFTNWTSGNEKLDSLIQKYQSKYDGDGEIFEWIPYDKFIDVKEVRKDDFAIASWTDGPLHYSKSNRKFERKLNKKVLLRYLNSSRNVNDDFLNKITYLMKNSYGISQNPNTKDYILVYKIGDYCENCGKKYNEFENHSKNCMSCRANQENEKINDLIQEMKLNIDYNANHILHNYIIFEWVPYDQFDDIKKIGQGGFSTVYSAIWKDGFLYFQGYTSTRIQDTRVALKCLHNSQNCLDEFISEV